jgi:hypothetical protein
MNRLLLISPDQGSGFKPIFSGKKKEESLSFGYTSGQVGFLLLRWLTNPSR